MLFCAARAELVERVIGPALEAGTSVVCDRFVDSTVAYQGDVRGLDGDLIETLNAAAVAGCLPDRTVLLRVDTEPGRRAGAGALRVADLRSLRIRGGRLPGADRRRVRADRRRRAGADRRRRRRGQRRRGPRPDHRGAGTVSDELPEALSSATAEQPAARAALSAALRRGPSHAYAFVGPTGSGKAASARAFAAALLAIDADDPADAGRRALLDPSPHPDLTWLRPPGNQHLVEDVRREIIGAVSYRPFEGRRRVFVVEAADAMAEESQNALLKTLEEPPGYAHLILITAEPAALLDTVLQPLLDRHVRAAPPGVAAAPAGERAPRPRPGGARGARPARRRGPRPRPAARLADRPPPALLRGELGPRGPRRAAREPPLGRPARACRRGRQATCRRGRRGGGRARRRVRQGARCESGQKGWGGCGQARRPPSSDRGDRPQPQPRRQLVRRRRRGRRGRPRDGPQQRSGSRAAGRFARHRPARGPALGGARDGDAAAAAGQRQRGPRPGCPLPPGLGAAAQNRPSGLERGGDGRLRATPDEPGAA